MTRQFDRRTVLAGCAGLLSTGIAGCSSDGVAGGSTPTETDPTPTEPETSSPSINAPTLSPTTSDGMKQGSPAESGTDGSPAESRSATPTATDTPTTETIPEPPTWKTAELTDVLEDETFRIQDFSDSRALLETFAVWCPICTSQQEQMAALQDTSEDIVIVSLNVDSNEDADQVRDHAESYGFDWRYAISPASVTSSLIDSFGPTITSPPSAPVVRICPRGSGKLLDTGVKSAGTLESSFEEC